MQTARPNISSRTRRRGVTLLEMLVTVALLLIMMLIIVAVFQAATGAVTVSRAFTLLDQDLRRLDTTIRQDLQGVEAIMTPPGIDPADTRPRVGYFELAENSLSDAQDEDSDDTLRFTAKAPPGRPFTGRMWVPKSIPNGDVPRYRFQPTLEPIPVTSQYAEIIYFQRGDRLYRRVRLINPQIVVSFSGAPYFSALPSVTPSPSLGFGNTPSDPSQAPNDGRAGAFRFGFRTNLFEPFDLFRDIPAPNGTVPTRLGGTPFVSWQGLNDVSARPSRYDAAFPWDYAPQLNTLADLADRHNRFASPRFADDFRNNNPAGPWVPPQGQFIPDGLPDDLNADGVADYYPTMYFNSKAAGLLNDSFTVPQSNPLGFPTNTPRPLRRDLVGFPWVYPNAFTSGIQQPYGLLHAPDPSTNTFNHNPLVTGDSLPVPDGSANSLQTWWGFPTWRETMAPTWLDPIRRINEPAAGPIAAPYFTEPTAIALGEAPYQQFVGLSPGLTASGTPFRLPPQPGPFSDNLPSAGQPNVFDLTTGPVFEDDLIAVNVRSFNIKAYDANPRYYDATLGQVVQLLPGFYDLGYASGMNPAHSIQTPPWMIDTLGHEGRMPPVSADNRVDPQHPTFVNGAGNVQAAGLGDDDPTVVRLRRTWDSWSTTYTKAPALPLDPSTPGPLNGGRAVVPSYPAPYPVPMRGIEIQIRITDPGSRYIKTLTIRQDFADKL